MEHLDPKTDGSSRDIVAQNLDIMRDLFPEVFTEAGVNFDALRSALGGQVDERAERYNFTWHGKSSARLIAQAPSTGTLRPSMEESVDWETTQNLFIEGDNLEVLKLLQKSYYGRVKMIYIDPPYNTGNEFIYPDKYQDNLDTYLRYTGQVGETGMRLTANAETSGRYHTNWLNMMYPRLRLARSLLRDDGVIFVTIDDHEVYNLRMVMNELFGEENFVAQIEWLKRYTRSNNTDNFTSVIDHVVVYAKSAEFKPGLFERGEEVDARYSNPDNDPRGPWKGASFLNYVAPEKRPNLCYEIVNPNTGQKTLPTKAAWRKEKAEFERLLADNRLYWGKDGTSPVPSTKSFLSEARQGMTPINFWSHEYAGHTDMANRELKELLGDKVFDTPKPTLLVRRMIQTGTSSDGHELVLDFFGGSGTTADAVMRQNAADRGNRRFVVVQLPEPTPNGPYADIAKICKARVRRAGAKLRSEHPLAALDTGFRAFVLDSTCIRPWDAHANDIERELFDSVQNIKTDRSDDDVLFEVLLKYGLDLSNPIDEHVFGGNSVHTIGGGALVMCLDPEVSVAAVEGIVRLRTQLKPDVMRVVFRDAGFSSDVSKTNALEMLRQGGITDVKSV